MEGKMHLNLSYMILSTCCFEERIENGAELRAVVLEYLNDLYNASGFGYPEELVLKR